MKLIDIKIYKKTDYFTIDVDISFVGGILVIQGESGAGKTTLLECIAGLRNPDKGRISIGDKLLFQNYALFPHMSVIENVLYGLKSRRIKDFAYAERIIDSFGIKHIKDKLPSYISGGEKQRTALARAIATKPSLLLLDEPFSALDKDTRTIVYDEFLSFKKNFRMDAILITHDENEAKLLGDSIIMLKDGKVVY
jgi:molybdate transport system ATP-binding protein